MEAEELAALQERCRAVIADKKQTVNVRVGCLDLLQTSGFPEVELISTLLPFFGSGAESEIQPAALRIYQSGVKSEAGGKAVVDFLPKSDSKIRAELVHLMTRRPAWATLLLNAVEAKQVQSIEISPADAVALRKHSDEAVSKKAAELLPEPPDRQEVVKRFQRALALEGDGTRGEVIFRERCMVCHRIGEEGGQVGPVMGEFQKHGKGQILLNFLDPNKTVQPDYLGYLVKLKNGEIAMGRILEDTTAGLSVRDVAGNDREISREEIESVTSTGRSLMPEGIEAGLVEQDVADLLHFISTYSP